jgi:hypothetical protein
MVSKCHSLDGEENNMNLYSHSAHRRFLRLRMVKLLAGKITMIRAEMEQLRRYLEKPMVLCPTSFNPTPWFGRMTELNNALRAAQEQQQRLLTMCQ